MEALKISFKDISERIAFSDIVEALPEGSGAGDELIDRLFARRLHLSNSL